MAKITIIADDGVVGVDGVFRSVDLTGLDPDIHAVQWDGAAGEIEYRDGRPPEVMNDLASFQSFVDLWTAAAPQAPTLDELKASKRGAFLTEGLRRIALQVPDWDSIEAIKAVAGLWPAIAGTANAGQLAAKDVYLYLRDTVPAKLAVVSSQAELTAIDPAQADPFGDGTSWPA